MLFISILASLYLGSIFRSSQFLIRQKTSAFRCSLRCRFWGVGRCQRSQANSWCLNQNPLLVQSLYVLVLVYLGTNDDLEAAFLSNHICGRHGLRTILKNGPRWMKLLVILAFYFFVIHVDIGTFNLSNVLNNELGYFILPNGLEI